VSPLELVVATRNPGKLSELRSLLSGVPVRLISARDVEGAPLVDEDADTLEGNARKKAEALYVHARMPALADDTGLEVESLGGVPGVHSARFAGPDADDAANRRRLLDALTGMQERGARFRTVIALVDDEGVRYFEGTCAGTVTREERGSAGFGYDSVFVPNEDTRTFAEMSETEKNEISHRGRALRELVAYLRERTASRASGSETDQ
jgi:XTP/dITP diphosphohydrolase